MPHDQIAFLGCVLVIGGMYGSRALMSIGMMVLFGNALLNTGLKTHWHSFLKRRHLVLLSGYFLLLALSGLWSANTAYWSERLQIALPFLVLPFAFHSVSRWDVKWYDRLMVLFILLNLGGIGWSLYRYLQQKEIYDIGYGFSKLIPTPFRNDHIRFSMSVVLCLTFCGDLLTRQKKILYRILLFSAMAVQVLYIHILAAKTGLISLYLVAFLFIVYLLFSVQYKRAGVLALMVMLLLPFVMYSFLPSFKNKIGYVRYSIEQMGNKEQQAHISDEGRLLSYRYALRSIRQHPFYGVGVGDVLDTMSAHYRRDFQDKPVTVLLPHNQFLMAGMSLGIPGVIFLCLMMLALFRTVRKNDYLYFSYCLMLLFAMMVEPLFETQYGTCLFLFFLLLLMKRSRYYLA
jgi:O-antigen ligase